jgi:cyclophilin family peptidyl-prolyl cis-trans isomerase
MTWSIAALLAAQLTATAPQPRVDPDRVLLRTDAGDLVLALYPAEAPKTVEMFKTLVRGGLYDGTYVFRVERGMLVQSSNVTDRSRPLGGDQLPLVRGFSQERNSLAHLRGVLTAAPGGSSFAILLSDAPHLDGSFNVFGAVEEGLDVLDEIGSVPVNSAARPLVRIEIQRAEILSRDAALLDRAPRRSLCSVLAAASDRGLRREIAAIVATMLFGILSIAVLGRRLSTRVLATARIVIAAVAVLGLLVVLLPMAPHEPLLGGGLLFGLVAFFKVLNRFETPRDEPPGPATGAIGGR